MLTCVRRRWRIAQHTLRELPLRKAKALQLGLRQWPAAKIRAEEKAAAEKRSKEKEKREECRKRAVTEKIALRERKPFMLSCEKK